ncbi:MAG: aminotransferase class V-fold PLP-dependent enzyme [Pseudomonadota bacterium]
MTTLDLDFVRAQFPAFDQPELEGWAFFENAGGSYPCRHVIDRLFEAYTKAKIQPYWSFPGSSRMGEMMDESRTRLAVALGVAEDEVHFGPSTTQNTYVLAQAFRQTLAEGDEIIVTNQDHEANTGPWRRLAEEGLVIREWQIDPATGHLDPADLDALIGERTRVLCFPHASNVVAEINPVAEIAAKMRGAGVVTVVDGVSYAPHGLPDVGTLGADIYLFSAYKTHGPHQGVMVVRRSLAERLVNQGHYFNADNLMAKLTPAGPDHAQIAALAGMVDYADALSAHHGGGNAHDLMRGAEIAVMAPLLDYLRSRNDIRLLGPTRAEDRAPTFAIELDRSGDEVAVELANHKIMCGGGDFYSRRTVEALGIDPAKGVLRVSALHYTTPGEIDRLIAALDAVL